jgi:nucleoside-diphosphate-sugar epimerase
MPRVLITGASGFLGRHLVSRFAEKGWMIEAIDLKPPPDNPAIVRAIQGDVRDCLPELDCRYDLAIHLAAYVAGRIGIEQNPLGVAENMALDTAFFSFTAKAKPSRCIYLSSSAVYPIARQTAGWDGNPLKEEEVSVVTGRLGVPDMTYGWAKLTGEYLAWMVQEKAGVPTAVYRPFSVYGPGQSDDYPMTAICRRALREEDPLVVWGSGKQQRDFVCIDDFLECVAATYETLDASAPLNIASGSPADFLTVAAKAAEAVSYSPQIKAVEGKPEGVQARVGCPERMSQWFTPAVDLSQGMHLLLEYLAAQPLFTTSV